MGTINPKEDILKNVGNQNVDVSHRLPWYGNKILWKSMANINPKEDILKNVGNQIVDGSHWLL